MKYIALRVRTAMLVHGYTADNQEIIEEFHDETFMEKLIAIERIQSVTEKYLLVNASHGRVMYWEYEGDLNLIAQRLNAAGLLIA
ncbi:hypothetical protein [Iodobacter sp.]|uniref:hypothetical protein n=1 Tax=Iodobacter sp. TaxID=1915058 RepID=UPI0025F1F179|nr:hypothetical protein [Iodobacter sp.]